ncbi:MAG: NAD(P)-binding domain-containing protein [Myxococcales bacterium]|nr:NAD(P)-binding domain-containing protein [Myxococcales bacterium]
MATIAVLGTGLLGRGFAENLLEKGHDVRVWNRTASKCAPIVQAGAMQGANPADAVRGADRVHLVLSEDPIVDTVITALRPGLADGVPIIDHSTNLPQSVAARVPALRAQGVRYVHAPVFMGPASSRNATGLMLISGASTEVDALREDLQSMTGRLVELGEEPSRAAAVKLAGNSMLASLTAAMGDVFRIGRANGVPDDQMLGLFEMFSPTPAGMGKRLLGALQADPSFELTMGRKDVRLMVETAGGPEGMLVLPAILAAIDRAIEAGHGTKDFGIFAHPDA